MSQDRNPLQVPLEQLELVLKEQLHALDIAISQIVRYKPFEWAETVDPRSMQWVLKHLQSKKCN